ncbi:glycerate kinase type-2 family protein [Rhodospirillum centenum]|uniref:Hydroxypyruvate reductase, putative n=1 Tax=Rhodospirillum centenum (strain ATCC 51521 / SW) TaxID=414684 RepID=B6ITY7_RHOCS|nr:glycerate kinase [Rhodospirillum centenum]ACI99523.1 hydroxypyruvate reductase, putative [Rhodospirillum centenum SW]
MTLDPRAPAALLRGLFDAAVAAVAAETVVPPALAALPPPAGRTLVIGAGKAAAAMAAAVERHWPAGSDTPGGLVVTRYGHGVPTRSVEVVEAGHPHPDAKGEEAARRILSFATGLGATGLGQDDLLLCLLSGGGSSLLALPAPGIALADKQAVGRALLRSGATIAEINTVRRHLSAIKGGRLAAAAWPARCVTLAVSDVPHDDPAVIASGPTVADPTTVADARAVLAKYGIEPPAAVRAHLARGDDETPKPGDPRLARSEFHLVARPMHALEAAAAAARAAGLEPVILGDSLEGEARDLGAAHAALARAARRGTVLLSGGETTVSVRGEGRGGRNAEYLLGLALALDDAPGVWAIACDTDGIDGTEDNAGALHRPGSLARARAAGYDPARSLSRNDAYGYFARLGDLVVTGPTRTNVNDFRAILIAPSA